MLNWFTFMFSVPSLSLYNIFDCTYVLLPLVVTYVWEGGDDRSEERSGDWPHYYLCHSRGKQGFITWPQATPTLSYVGSQQAAIILTAAHYNNYVQCATGLGSALQVGDIPHFSQVRSDWIVFLCSTKYNNVRTIWSNVWKIVKFTIAGDYRSHNLVCFLVENLTQCLLGREKKSFSMTNMKMIDQVCYSLCDKFTTITSFCDNLLCKEGSVRRYYRHNDTFTFSIYSITPST